MCSKFLSEPVEHARVFWLGFALVLAGSLLVILHAFVGTFVLSLFFYYASRPIYDRLRRRIQPPTFAAAVALFVLILPIVLLFWYTAALGLEELRTLSQLDLSGYEELLAPYLNFVGSTEASRALFKSLLSNPRQVLTETQLQTAAMDFLATMTRYLGVVLTGALHLFIAFALAFYLLRDGERLVTWGRTHFSDETLAIYVRAVDADLKTVFFGNILNALLTGTIGAIVFSILAAIAPPEVPVPVPILLGLLAGAGSLIPVIGMKIIYVPVSLYLTGLAAISGSQLLWFPLVFFIVSFIAVDTIPDVVIRPYVSGRNLHVGAVMFAYIFGPLLFGWYGLFLGPLILVVIADFARIVVPSLIESSPGPAATSLTGVQIKEESDAKPVEDSPSSDNNVPETSPDKTSNSDDKIVPE